MPHLRIPRLVWDTIRVTLMVPVVIGMVFMELVMGARRTEMRISIDEEPYTFVFIAEFQEHGNRHVPVANIQARHSTDGRHEEERHDQEQGHRNSEDHDSATYQAREGDTAEQDYDPMGTRSPDNESLDYDDSPTEVADDDYSEDDDSRPGHDGQPGIPAPATDETLGPNSDKTRIESGSNEDTHPDPRLAPEPRPLALRAGREPYLEPLRLIIHGHPHAQPFRQENEPPVMVNAMMADETLASHIESLTLPVGSKKEMPFAVMQSNVFDLRGDCTETEGSDMEF